MAKFNKNTSVTYKANTTNLAGGQAFKQTDKTAFASLLLTSLLKARCYRSEAEQIAALKHLAGQITDKQFLAKAAIYARNEFGNRSITHVAAAEIAHTVKGELWTKKFLQQVVRRPDDMTEILAYYLTNYGKPIPNSLKKGLALAFNKFDAYQLAKYRGDGKAVSLIDVVNLVRPVPTDRNREALAALVKGDLKNEKTWEAMLSAAGSNDEEKADAWKTLLSENKLGYFAALRNINNVIAQGDDETFNELLSVLTNRDQIKKSLVFPYRYLTALNNIKDTGVRGRKALEAITIAFDIACDNVPDLDGETLVVCDYSGSMGDGIRSDKGTGSVFGAVLAKKCNADFMIFGDIAAYVPYNPAMPALTLANEFMTNNQCSYGSSGGDKKIQVGHGTNFHGIFQTANKKYKRIAIFSDMQGWVGGHSPEKTFQRYCSKFGIKPVVYSFDLAGYGTTQLDSKDCIQISGFSEKIFDLMPALESGVNTIADVIDQVEIG